MLRSKNYLAAWQQQLSEHVKLSKRCRGHGFNQGLGLRVEGAFFNSV